MPGLTDAGFALTPRGACRPLCHHQGPPRRIQTGRRAAGCGALHRARKSVPTRTTTPQTPATAQGSPPRPALTAGATRVPMPPVPGHIAGRADCEELLQHVGDHVAGQMLLQRIPSGPWSMAMALVRASTAPFDALYAARPGSAQKPSTEETLMMEPPPARRSSGSACLVPEDTADVDRHDVVPLDD